MTDHPMQPTNRQILEWFEQSSTARGLNQMDMPAAHLARMAYAAGADAELDACCGFIGCEYSVAWSDRLRTARRPKPSSDKQRGLAALSQIMSSQKGQFDGNPFFILKEILEALPDPQD